MTKTKHLSILMVLIICLSSFLTGCGGNDTENTQTGAESETAAVETQDGGKITIGFAQAGSESAWREANTASVQEACQNDPEIELIFENADGNIDKQRQAVQSFIDQKVDVIALAPVVEDGWKDMLTQAKSAGIPVVLVDRTVAADCQDLYNCWIGADFLLEGYNGGDWIVTYMAEKGLDKGTVNVAVLQGTLGASAEKGRTQGVREILSSYSNYNIVLQDTGDFSFSGGKAKMIEYLNSGVRIDVLVAQNDDMALGAIEAMKERGVVPGKDIIILSFDGVRAAFEAMINGEIQCVVECNPLSGEALVETAKKLVNGDSVEREVYVLEGIYPADVAADYINNRKY